MRSLGQHLADARQQLSDQARIVQQLGLDAAARLHESSDRLASNASVIANANDQLARSGDVAMQRMDGLLAGQIGRAHVCTPVTNAHLVCRLLLEKNNRKSDSN